MTEFPNLFTPYTLKNVRLRNRIVMLPHVTFYATAEGRPSPRLKNYYVERAKGGAGLIVTESQMVHVTGGVGNCVDMSRRESVAAWRDGIAAVQDHGAKIFAQLTHHGLEAVPLFSRRELWGPSPIPNPAVGEIPKAMDKGDIKEAIKAFRLAAAHVRQAGFDGLELKVGHDGLLRTFLSPFYNRRRDEYGGSPENRARFVMEVLDAVRTAVGDDFPIGFRFCLDEGMPGGYELDEALAYAEMFAGSGQLDYFSSDMGTWMNLEMQVPPMTIPQGFALVAVGRLKEATDLPVIAFGRIKRPQQAEAILAGGQAELVGMARQFITDPAWPLKVQEGRLEEIRPCVACNQECVGRLQNLHAIACVHNPAAGHEAEWGMGTLHETAAPKNVLVVGGGPFGLKTAEVAAKRGHHVTLIEKGDKLGGQVRLAAGAPHHAEWGQIVTHLAAQVRRLGVALRLNTEATADSILAESPDAVVVATGSGPGFLPFPAEGEIPIHDEWEVMDGAEPAGQNVLLYDLGVKFEGAALAETLAARGNRVQWVTPAFVVGAEIDPSNIGPLRRRLAQHEVETTPEHTIAEVNDAVVVLFNVLSQQVTAVPDVDAIVIAGNKASQNSLYKELKGKVPALYSGGDAVAPRNVYSAIVDGERVGREI